MRTVRVGIYAWLLVGVVVTLGLAGCGRAREKARVADAEYAAPEAPPQALSPDKMSEESGAADETTDVTVASAAGAAAGITRRIIKTGEIRLEVSDLDATMGKAEELATGVSGYVSNSSVSENDEGGRSGYVTVRVPSERFDEVFAQLRALGDAISYSEKADDVTEEWVDLEARISNKKAEEQSLLELLKRKGELSDILQVQREMFRVRGEVEQLEGRMRYLKDQVALSTIEVTIDELGPAGIAERGPWRIGYHLRTAWHALARIVEAVIYAVIYMIIAGAVFWVPVVLLIWWIRRRRRARRAAQP